MELSVLGIDLAKSVFQLHGVDARGKAVLNRRLTRRTLLRYVAQLPRCTIAMETCISAHYWARRFQELGHDVQLISPQFVKPFVKSNKNDNNDAEAICEAATRPSMRFVAINTVEQQDIQSMHRMRQRQMKSRTAMINQLRGLLAEYGIVIAQGPAAVRRRVPEVLEDAENELTITTRRLIALLYEHLSSVDSLIRELDQEIDHVAKQRDDCQRLQSILGVGPMIATALVAAVGDAKQFKNGRQMAAWLGLVPRQHSSGNRTTLLGISKRGDTYLRTLLVHGARAVVQQCSKRTDRQTRCLQDLCARRGTNIASVALANKSARAAWAMLANGSEYCAAA